MRNDESGFVLLEILLGIIFLAVIIVIITPKVVSVVDNRNRDIVIRDFTIIADAVDHFRNDTGFYPETSPPGYDPGLISGGIYRKLGNWQGPYLSKWPMAPSGSVYRYIAYPLEGSETRMIWVGLEYYGRDGISWLSDHPDSMGNQIVPDSLEIAVRREVQGGDDLFYLIELVPPERIASFDKIEELNKTLGPPEPEYPAVDSTGSVTLPEGEPELLQPDTDTMKTRSDTLETTPDDADSTVPSKGDIENDSLPYDIENDFSGFDLESAV